MNRASNAYTVSTSDPNVRHYPPNAVVIQQDTPDDGCIYIFEKGTLGVFKNGEMVSEIHEMGTVVGEMAPILSTTRTATIKTITECRVMVCQVDLRKSTVEPLSPVAQKIIMAITGRLQYQTTLHAEDLIRIENLQQMNQQLRKQVIQLNKQLEELSPATTPKKRGSLFGRHS